MCQTEPGIQRVLGGYLDFLGISGLKTNRIRFATYLWSILPRDVRTLTFGQLMGFPLNH